jgi:hypothetical protein
MIASQRIAERTWDRVMTAREHVPAVL